MKREVKTMNRNLSEVLEQIIALTPETETDLCKQLRYIKEQYDKEPMDFWWSITAQRLEDNLAKFDWVTGVRRLFHSIN